MPNDPGVDGRPYGGVEEPEDFLPAKGGPTYADERKGLSLAAYPPGDEALAELGASIQKKTFTGSADEDNVPA